MAIVVAPEVKAGIDFIAGSVVADDVKSTPSRVVKFLRGAGYGRAAAWIENNPDRYLLGRIQGFESREVEESN